MKSPSTATLILALALTTFASAQKKDSIEVNGIAAKVNGRAITKNEVTFMLAPIAAQLNAQYPRRGE